jgi:hypothetical protein
MFRTILRQTTLLTACLPVVWVVLLVFLILRTRYFTDGSSFHSMAKFAPFPIHFAVTQTFFLAFPLLAVASIVQTVLVRRWFADFPARRAFVLLGISVLASIAFIALNPGGYFLWFFD